MQGARRKLKAWVQAVLMACASGSALAVPVTFTGSFDSFTPGSGYGADGPGVEVWPLLPPLPVTPPAPGTPLQGGEGGTLLDVVFTATNTSTVTFTLPAAGASVTATICVVELRERFIDAAELDGLDVVANFTFSSPVAGPITVSATGTATVGPVPPVPTLEALADVDLVIDWDPVQVPFGAGGLFELSLADLSFNTLPLPPPLGTGGGSVLNQTATITLLREPRTVPEPAMLMLLGLGFAGLALARTRRC